MRPSRIPIDPGLLKQLYVEEGFSTAKVAMKLGCAGATILRRLRLLGWMYYAPGIPCLARKRDKAARFLAPLGHASGRPAGRPRMGWLYTVPAKGQ